MKTKTLFNLASIALLSFASCTNDMQELQIEQSQLLKQIVMTTEDFQPEAGSRTLYDIDDGTVKCTWAAKDTVGVFPNEGIQTAFPMASGAGTKNAAFDGGGWALKDGSMYAAYYPFIGDFYLDKHAVPLDYTGQLQEGNGSMVHLGAYDYMVSLPVAPEFGFAQFMFKHLSTLVQLKLTIPQPAVLSSVELVADAEVFAVKGKVDIMAAMPGIKAVTHNKNIKLDLQNVKTTEADQVVTFYMMLPPADLSNQTLKAVVTTDKATLEMALESKNFQAGKVYALSGSSENGEIVGVGSYKNGVVSLAEAGTMKKLLGKDYLNITSLKVVGPINGDDVYYLRKMLGGVDFSKADWGKLETLDLSDARIVEGGGWYYNNYYTSNNVVGDYMFYRCANLQNIVLPKNVVSLGDYAFYQCSTLESIGIQSNIVSIGSYAFTFCRYLESIEIPSSVASIGSYAFDDCWWLEKVYISDLAAWCKIDFTNAASNPLANGSDLYLNNYLVSELNIPREVKELKDGAFCGCSSIINVTVYDDVTSIGQQVFQFCENLSSVTIGNGVTYIGNYAFYGCNSLEYVSLGNNVKSLGRDPFLSCKALSRFYIYAENPPSLVTEWNASNASYDPLFGEVKDEAILYVPMRSGSKYKSKWGKIFENIIEME